MRSDRLSHGGFVLYGGLSLLVVTASVLAAAHFWPVGAPPLRPRASVSGALGERHATGPGAPGFAAPALATANGPDDDGVPGARVPRGADIAAALVDRYAALVAGAPTGIEQEEMARFEAELVALGEVAAPSLVARIDAWRGAPLQRDRLLDVVRRLPGKVAEDCLIREARSGREGSSRALAMEALGERRTGRAIEALTRVALTDADLPARTLITSPRDPNDPSTELPDEVVYTPRMQAMTALASTRDARAADVLTGVLRDGPDESLRMYAARHLEDLRDTPGTADALLAAATNDASPYVRLAALHALEGSTDRSMGAMLEKIAMHDGDAGVRALARQVLASLGQ